MMRRHAKKPKILKEKIELANLILKTWKRITYHKSKAGYSWNGVFVNYRNVEIYISFQRYVRRFGVDYVRINYNKNFKGRALSPREVKTLLRTNK